VDFVSTLIAGAAATGASVFFLGGEEGTAPEAARRAKVQHPSLQIAGVLEPPRRKLSDLPTAEIIETVRRSGARILLVALGHPKQDQWIAANAQATGVSVAVGVGCTFDLIAGRVSRAPRFIQALGLEWIFRFIHEPLRLGPRYVSDGWYLLAVLLPHTVVQRLKWRPNATLV
ncbi:MAG TPA: WecB/TagA/CpsF family glycosyltransferase, partial [Pseudonocardiaceae bacterium]|nr:WecB/TagA/CpsF family glycosyltransferase [Pseudonocardiaceae bacterium]